MSRTPAARVAAIAALVLGTATLSGPPAGAAPAAPEPPPKTPTSVGTGGAVSSVDPYVSRIGLRVLRRGGNAADAAVAMASAAGVTEPYSAGIGGGGFFVHYDARTGDVRTIDGRETAPDRIRPDAFIDPDTGEPYEFFPDLVTSGVSVGVPGTAETWRRALQRWGTWSLDRTLQPSVRLARRGFVVDPTFRQQTLDNEERFSAIRSTRALFLPRGRAPRVGSTFRNPDLADTLARIGRLGPRRALHTGPLAREIVRTVQDPPTVRGTDLPVPPGSMTRHDLAGYQVRDQPSTVSDYRGLEVHGMRPSSSGGTGVGEALNILEQYDVAAMDDAEALHHYLEASALSFADRAAYLGDSAYVDVPVAELLDDTFAAERACRLDPDQAATKPVPAGDVTEYDGECDATGRSGAVAEDHENLETTNLTVVDRWGDVVEYTLTIEQTGGSGLVVPGRGFLLNNELTDFSLKYDRDDPNRIQPGKRPRSSMSPTIILDDGRPVLALGSPGGSTIITTVLQLVLNHVDRGMPLPEAMAAPRASQRNTPSVTAEPAFIEQYGAALEAYGHELTPSGDGLTSASDIGAATAIGIGPDGRLTAVAEPRRRGGGAAYVVRPAPAER
ncbi:gamma-glutamyltransferase [Nocardioides sp. GXQ0305]|uniref:gamma-glutamyltransferase n=1 Tax=Nocardioides sp. GXQ0305 TaxID=3423912 RepID=UPI003D7DCF4E